MFTLSQSNDLLLKSQGPVIKSNIGSSQKTQVMSYTSKSGQTQGKAFDLPRQKLETKIYSFGNESSVQNNTKNLRIPAPKLVMNAPKSVMNAPKPPPFLNMQLEETSCYDLHNSVKTGMNSRPINLNVAANGERPIIKTNNACNTSKFGKY